MKLVFYAAVLLRIQLETYGVIALPSSCQHNCARCCTAIASPCDHTPFNFGSLRAIKSSREEEAPVPRRGFFKETSAWALIGLLSMGDGANALAPEEASSSYDNYASSYDNLDGGPIAAKLGIDDARVTLLQSNYVHGNVLEIGVGTGLNMDKYRFQDPQAEGTISSITFLDVSEGMLQQAKERAQSLSNMPKGDRVKFVKADATSQLEDLFGENSLDTVIDTFSLCVLGNEGALKCLKQMKNVVKRKEDGGKILLLENSRADNLLLGWYQDRTANAAASLGGKGCVYNQNVPSLISEAGLIIEDERSYAGGLFRAFVCVREP